MLKWLNKAPERTVETRLFSSVTDGLQRLYKEKLLPLEKDHDFHHFYSPELTPADFTCRPMVLLIGQYSTGKTTFIRHLLGRDYPGLRVGPEPTTDKFVAVVHGNSDQIIPGNAIASDQSLPFTQLDNFGNAFLSRFECAKLPCQICEGISLVDTPGILAGEKQRTKRGYEFEAVMRWFSDRVDMILVLFDVSKMDISDEFRRVLVALKGNDHKIHICLNKADQVTTPQLMRVYGAMMWSLGKVIDTAEVSRVYIGSFWDEPLTNDQQRRLFESEENDLYTYLACLPRSAATRKLNDLIKRARMCKVHAFTLEHLKRKMPSTFGKDKEKKRLIEDLPKVFKNISTEKSLAIGDFPDPKLMQEKLASMDFTKFMKVDKKKMDMLDVMLSTDLPKLLEMLSQDLDSDVMGRMTSGGAAVSAASPFAVLKVGGATEASAYRAAWLVPPDPEDYRAEFMVIGPDGSGKLPAQKAKQKMVESKLPSNALHKIWTLADVDKDGALTLYEYSLARHFIKMKLDGQDIPATLPPQMHPGATLAAGDHPSPQARSPINSGVSEHSSMISV